MKENNLVALASRLSEMAHKLIVQELEARGIEGIVPSHGAILSQLFAGDSFTMRELGEKIHRSKSTMTVLVDKLVSLGYVSKGKDNDDCRITWIRLTPKGKELKPSFMEVSKMINEIIH